MRTKHLRVLNHTRIKGEVGAVKHFKPFSICLLTAPQQCFSCGSFLLSLCFMFAIVVVLTCLFLTCWERADLLALLCVMFYCVFVTFTNVVQGQVWYFIVSTLDLCLLLYFDFKAQHLT